MISKTKMELVGFCLALSPSLSLILVETGAAQSASQDSIQDATRSGKVCTSMEGASRIRTTCDGEKAIVRRSEAELTTTVRLAAPEVPFCSGQINVDYAQWDTIARVEGKLVNETCAASTGEYEIVVRIKDDSGEIKTLEFVETWQRSDDLPITFMKDYTIGENVELIRLNARWLRCTCLEDVEDPH